MKKATGPAKVEASVTPQGSPVSGVVALLFNFDFDDAVVKPEHQNWLSENLVPPLKADPGQRVFLRGMASKAGNADYNLQLSRRRVEAVRNFLISKGAKPAQVVTSFTGENLSTSKFADDERDRAIEAIFQASTGPIRFERMLPVEALDGFHRKEQEMVVGNPDVKLVRLLGARGSLVESLRPDVVRVTAAFQPAMSPVVATSDNMVLQLLPTSTGTGAIVARLPGLATATAGRLALIPDIFRPEPKPPPEPPLRKLNILTLFPRVVTLSFHYVKQAPPNANGVVTARTPSEVFDEEVVAEMNRIYSEQTKIRFIRTSTRVVSTGFAGPVTVGSHRFLAGNLTQNVDTSTRLRIFFVEKIAPSNGENVFASSQGFPFKNILFRDAKAGGGPVPTDAKKTGLSLAHECGHSFGIKEHPDPNPKHLMHEKQFELEGEIIPPDTAKIFNDNAILRAP
jgi:OmpA family